ncbi:FeoA family protein [[Clostridium] dakarense]|uniref:FeoA family protein n=1 Tax=Faecalimicrobium dakarense TaxID=1301100 RepID=UPI0004B91CAD|nr:ferrous iron transport protein A [[Clostridium] dakarense]
MSTLKDIKNGESAKVKKILGQGAIRRRIMDMGITRGCEVNICNIAPLGDPIVINVRGYELSLRKSDAEMIVVED